eukprot:COSAG05_NODE_17648_length_322_cov_0.385650_2_plen_61_part_01
MAPCTTPRQLLFNEAAAVEMYTREDPLDLHDALPILGWLPLHFAVEKQAGAEVVKLLLEAH